MKRAGDLFDDILDRDNLRLAAAKALRGKRGRPDARAYAADLEANLAALAAGLRDGTVEVGRVRQFRIFDPKERVISAPAFAERVLHHAVMNVCEPHFERWLIADTFACRRGKGRDVALARARQFAGRHGRFLKFDVRKYFDSVPHDRLLALLGRRFKDRRLLALFGRVVRSYRATPAPLSRLCGRGVGGEGGASEPAGESRSRPLHGPSLTPGPSPAEPGEGGKNGPAAADRGLPIGALTSQHFANFYLGWLDRLFKDRLRVPGYVRYMDDVAAWSDDPAELAAALAAGEEFLRDELGLALKPVPYRNRTAHGMDFLGCRVFPRHLGLNRRSRVRYRRRLAALEEAHAAGAMSEVALQARATALAAFASAAGVSSWRLRRSAVGYEGGR